MPGVIVDIGTGDGEFVYKIAKENPDRFVIGIDPQHKGLERISARIYKKPTKGGIKNAIFVLSNLEDLPEELDEIANQVFINLPWAGLLKGILLVEDNTWNPVKRICQRGALIDILISYEKSREDDEFRKFDLPAIDSSYLKNIMTPKLEAKGFKVLAIKNIASKELMNYPSSWAKKLGFGRDRKYYYLRIKVEYQPGPAGQAEDNTGRLGWEKITKRGGGQGNLLYSYNRHEYEVLRQGQSLS